jgi:cupin-like protein
MAHPTNSDETCATVPIERVECMSPEIFQQRYLSGRGKPVIVTGALNAWPAHAKWNFDFFKSRYGSERVVPAIWPGDKYLKVIQFSDYIDSLDDPHRPTPGFWIDLATKLPCEVPPTPPGTPLYLTGWRAFNLHPELLDDVELSPKFADDWFPLLPAAFRKILEETTKYLSGGFLIGPAGSVATLHADILHTHAYLAQIAGRKKCVLFSPEDSEYLYGGKADPTQPDFEKFPLLRRATPYECILVPGELLFIPSDWWHHVVALEKSITVSYNFFNRANFGAYIQAILQDLPVILKGLEKYPTEKALLGIDWTSKDFDYPA